MKEAGVKLMLLVVWPTTLFISLPSIPVLRCASALADPVATPASRPQIPTPAFAAMAYYDANCAHCHGPQGTFYGPTLGQKLSDSQLIKVISDMAAGPGNAPLKPDQLPVETAFHRALIMREPFLSVTQMDPGGRWQGETMPDAKVTIVINGQPVDATLDDTTWTAQLPVGINPKSVEIRAELNGVVTELKPAVSTFSNSTPLPAPSARPK